MRDRELEPANCERSRIGPHPFRRLLRIAAARTASDGDTASRKYAQQRNKFPVSLPKLFPFLQVSEDSVSKCHTSARSCALMVTGKPAVRRRVSAMWEGEEMLKPTAALVKEGLHTRFKSSRLGSSLLRFRDDESGVMTVFILFIFVLMFVFGGIAVDYMRFEIRRVAMQQTMDRAALAASSLTQTETPQDVVNDYFAKEGLGDGLRMVDYSAPTVAVEESSSGGQPTSRKVNVSASVRSYNYFMGSFFLPYEYHPEQDGLFEGFGQPVRRLGQGSVTGPAEPDLDRGDPLQHPGQPRADAPRPVQRDEHSHCQWRAEHAHRQLELSGTADVAHRL
ncbi:MAG: pilus assembly protein TadG-related protein [Tabrizicola sp.]|nr:pilus assembly protein TadG-related protein [Tabrizicola sp.]